MVGARAEFQSACLVVDMGTAVTIDALDGEGRHLGGQIIAGVALMTDVLAASTSDIPRVKPAPATGGGLLDMFAGSTAAAVREGASNAVVGAIDRAFDVLASAYCEPALVLTGGDASRILNALCVSPMHRPNLVLAGLAHMLDNPR
jgi:type III pantothenate kinase